MPFYATATAADVVSAVVSLLIANGHSKHSRIASATASPHQRCIYFISCTINTGSNPRGGGKLWGGLEKTGVGIIYRPAIASVPWESRYEIPLRTNYW